MNNALGKNNILKRLKNAYLAMPVAGLEIEKGNIFGPLFKGQTAQVCDLDTQHLAMRLIDFLAERLAVGQGASRKEIVDRLSKDVKLMFPKASDSLCKKIASRVLDRLANGQNNYKAFSYSFFDTTEGKIRAFSFRLVEYWQPSLGEAHVFRATPEAVTLFLSMFTIDPILEQAAQSFLIRHLLETGHFTGAVEVARRASGISTAAQAELQSCVLDLKRNPRKRGWVDYVINKLKDAHSHIESRYEEEEDLLATINDMLDAEQETEQQFEDLIKLKMIIEKCKEDHLNLGTQVGHAVKDFDRYHGHAFITPSIAVCISPEEEIIPRVMDMPLGAALNMANELGCHFLGPREPKILDIFEVFTMFEEARLREMRESEKEFPEVVDIDVCILGEFDEEREGRMRDLVNSCVQDQSASCASEIFSVMDHADCHYEREDYVATMHVLRSVFRRESDLNIKAVPSGKFKHRYAVGMNLLMSPGREE